MQFRAEFHIHSVLSADADLTMIPPLILQKAQDDDIRLIAITDHNASANVPAMLSAAAGTGITVLPGVELETVEGIHLLCLFDNLEKLEQLQKIIDLALPLLQNNEEVFGSQLIVDPEGNFLRHDRQLRQVSSSITLLEAYRNVHNLGGLIIPAHIDRRSNGMLAILGGFPPDLSFPIVEVSKFVPVQEARNRFPEIGTHKVISGGDAHYLDDILGMNRLELKSSTASEVLAALKQPSN
jgi:hypothetical protein